MTAKKTLSRCITRLYARLSRLMGNRELALSLASLICVWMLLGGSWRHMCFRRGKSVRSFAKGCAQFYPSADQASAYILRALTQGLRTFPHFKGGGLRPCSNIAESPLCRAALMAG